MDADAIERLLYHDCGLKGVSGISNDMRDAAGERRPARRAGDRPVRLADRRELGALAAVLGGLDGLVFTAGIGERSPEIRARVCERAAWLGIELDEAANRPGGPRISTAGSRVAVYAIPTDEELMIARHTLAVLRRRQPLELPDATAEAVRPVPFDANLRRLEGKKGLVIGIANENSIAYGCARAFRSFGAELAITYLNEKAKPYVEPLASALEAPILMPLDVQVEGQLEAVFEEIERRWGRLDFALHSIAFAPKDDLHGRVVDCSREGFLLAMDVSCHSFIRMARLAEPLMKDGGALFTMSYFGAERVVENYNLMGPVKAALEASARYLAAELGPKGIRVHAISPGPLKTRAASGIAAFRRAARQGGGARAGAQPGDDRRRRLRDRRARDRCGPADHRRHDLHRRRLPHHGLTPGGKVRNFLRLVTANLGWIFQAGPFRHQAGAGAAVGPRRLRITTFSPSTIRKNSTPPSRSTSHIQAGMASVSNRRLERGRISEQKLQDHDGADAERQVRVVQMRPERQRGVELVAAVEQIEDLADGQGIDRNGPAEGVRRAVGFRGEERGQREGEQDDRHEGDAPHAERIQQRTIQFARRPPHDIDLVRLECDHQAQRDRRHHVDPEDLRRRDRAVKPRKTADMMTNACATLVGNMNRIAFSMLL